YQIMNLSKENPVKVSDTTSLKIGFCVVGRKKKPGVALQSPYEQQQSTTPPPTKSGMPIYHANAKRGHVPWTDVEKVAITYRERMLAYFWKYKVSFYFSEYDNN
ncbi:hypothetical protein Tco_1387211, partial [Tanacetum coccineum]